MSEGNRPEDMLPDPTTPGGFATTLLLGPLGPLVAVPAAVGRLLEDMVDRHYEQAEPQAPESSGNGGSREDAREDAHRRLLLP